MCVRAPPRACPVVQGTGAAWVLCSLCSTLSFLPSTNDPPTHQGRHWQAHFVNGSFHVYVSGVLEPCPTPLFSVNKRNNHNLGGFLLPHINVGKKFVVFRFNLYFEVPTLCLGARVLCLAGVTSGWKRIRVPDTQRPGSVPRTFTFSV